MLGLGRPRELRKGSPCRLYTYVQAQHWCRWCWRCWTRFCAFTWLLHSELRTLHLLTHSSHTDAWGWTSVYPQGCYPAAKATAWTWPGHSLRLCALLCALCELQCRHGVPSPSTVSLALPDSGSCHLPAPPQIPAELPPRSWVGLISPYIENLASLGIKKKSICYGQPCNILIPGYNIIFKKG